MSKKVQSCIWSLIYLELEICDSSWWCGKAHIQVKRSSIFMEALLQIYMLKLKLEAVQREYLHLMALKTEYLNLIKHSQVPKEVKVEKIEEGFLVRVKCENAGDTLVSVLEAFEELGLTVLKARISSNKYFSMEAVAVAENQNQDQLDVRDITQAITRATEFNGH